MKDDFKQSVMVTLLIFLGIVLTLFMLDSAVKRSQLEEMQLTHVPNDKYHEVHDSYRSVLTRHYIYLCQTDVLNLNDIVTILAIKLDQDKASIREGIKQWHGIDESCKDYIPYRSVTYYQLNQ